MKINELHNQPVKPDTYEASMALNQLLKIGKHAIKIHNMIDDRAEMEAWVAKKIDLAGDYVKKVHGYMQGEKAGLYDDGGMTEDEDKKTVIHSITPGSEKEKGMMQAAIFQGGKRTNVLAATPKDLANQYIKNGVNYNDFNFLHTSDVDFPEEDDGWNNEKYGNDAHGFIQDALKILKNYKGESVSEDAGEGHMSKSTLYHTAKYAIELMDMINKGDDLEGWVQSKLNKAADYLQGVHNYEEYQKLNPYREELDANILQKHAGIVQKNIDEILARETSLDDVDTKPGMMRILAKRVNEVEKEIAKKTRKDANEGDMEQDKENPIAKPYINKPEWKALHDMDDKIIHAYLKHKEHKTNESGILYRAGVKKYGKAGMKAIQSAAAKGANHQEIGKIKDKHLKDGEVLDEGLKDWAKNLAMAGVVVAGLAGVGSINDAINNSVPAVKAMNTALELAQDQGNDELAKMIEKDIRDAKVRLDSGRDLNHVKYLQDKYSKFIQTEGLAYESKLAILLNQRLK